MDNKDKLFWVLVKYICGFGFQLPIIFVCLISLDKELNFVFAFFLTLALVILFRFGVFFDDKIHIFGNIDVK